MKQIPILILIARTVSGDADGMASLSEIEDSDSEDESRYREYHNDHSTFQTPTKTRNKNSFPLYYNRSPLLGITPIQTLAITPLHISTPLQLTPAQHPHLSYTYTTPFKLTMSYSSSPTPIPSQDNCEDKEVSNEELSGGIVESTQDDDRTYSFQLDSNEPKNDSHNNYVFTDQEKQKIEGVMKEEYLNLSRDERKMISHQSDLHLYSKIGKDIVKMIQEHGVSSNKIIHLIGTLSRVMTKKEAERLMMCNICSNRWRTAKQHVKLYGSAMPNLEPRIIKHRRRVE